MAVGEGGGLWLQVAPDSEKRLQGAGGKNFPMVVWERRLRFDVRKKFRVLPREGGCR